MDTYMFCGHYIHVVVPVLVHSFPQPPWSHYIVCPLESYSASKQERAMYSLSILLSCEWSITYLTPAYRADNHAPRPPQRDTPRLTHVRTPQLDHSPSVVVSRLLSSRDNQPVLQTRKHCKYRPRVCPWHKAREDSCFPHIHVPIDRPSEGQSILYGQRHRWLNSKVYAVKKSN